MAGLRTHHARLRYINPEDFVFVCDLASFPLMLPTSQALSGRKSACIYSAILPAPPALQILRIALSLVGLPAVHAEDAELASVHLYADYIF